MIKEQTITFCGKKISLRYCAATETGFERITGKSATVFLPTQGEPDKDGKPTYGPPTATTEDYIALGISAAIASRSKAGEKPQVNMDDALFDAGPEEVKNLITTTLNLRNDWYAMPDVVKPEQDTEGDETKNA